MLIPAPFREASVEEIALLCADADVEVVAEVSGPIRGKFTWAAADADPESDYCQSFFLVAGGDPWSAFRVDLAPLAALALRAPSLSVAQFESELRALGFESY